MGNPSVSRNFCLPLLCVLASLSVAGCAGQTRVGGAQGLTVLDRNQLPTPTIADLGASHRPYRVGPFDRLQVDVFGSKDLSQEIQVDASGRISFPLIGTVEVAGKTPNEVGTLMESLLTRGRFVRNPQVTVNLKEIVSQTVTIGGEVREPGVYPVLGRMTLMRGIATAKGMTEFSKKSEVLVFRTVNGKDYVAAYDIGAIQRGVYGDPEIYPNDVVMVGDSQARRLFKDLLQTTPLLAPVILLLRN